MDIDVTQIPHALRSIFMPQLEQLRARPLAVPFGVAGKFAGPLADGWFWGCAIDDGCLLTTMHMVARKTFCLQERPNVDYSVLGLLSGIDTGLINDMREANAAAAGPDPFSEGFSPTLPRNAFAFSMHAGLREFEITSGSLHDSTNICMLAEFVERVQELLAPDAPSLPDAFAQGTELNGSPQLLQTMQAIVPAEALRAGAPLHYRALVYDALSSMASQLKGGAGPTRAGATEVADAVNAALAASLMDPPGLEALAARLFMGKTQLCQRFKAEAGMSVGQRLAQLRVDEAKRRLERSDEPVADIAHALGYAHASSFAAMFQKHTHMTPTAWRAARAPARARLVV